MPPETALSVRLPFYIALVPMILVCVATEAHSRYQRDTERRFYFSPLITLITMVGAFLVISLLLTLHVVAMWIAGIVVGIAGLIWGYLILTEEFY